ncbi:MAG: DUF4236 domain-containing protein [Ethanoligenens sp.]
MGWRVHRSVKIAPGVRLNIGKKGTSVSLGRKGARVTVGKNRVTRTIGIPGTGIYNTKTTTLHKKAPARSTAHSMHPTRPTYTAPSTYAATRPPKPLGPAGRFFLNLLAILSFLMAGFFFLSGIAVFPIGIIIWIGTAIFIWLGIKAIKKTKKPSLVSDQAQAPSVPVQNGMSETMPLVAETESPQESPQAATQTAVEPRTMYTKITSVTRGNRQQYLTGCYAGQRLMVKSHPLEKFPHALAVYTLKKGEDKPGIMLGYLPDDLAQELFQTDTVYRATITELTGGTDDKPIRGCNIKIEF